MQIEPLGDDALLLRLGERIDVELNRRVLVVAARIESQRPPWLRDCVPAYASLALFVDTAAFPADRDPLAEAEAWLRSILAATKVGATLQLPPRTIEIPVRYGGQDGPDLDALALELGIPAREVIARHRAPLYQVAMLGFAPGFPYLLGLDPILDAPRLATPRHAVPAGSVGIGGSQTGIYPRASPGGWRLIGRTSLSLFDAGRDPPALLQAGDNVRFVES
jgi:inhibitor of KinA